jgi:hypothetical protein
MLDKDLAEQYAVETIRLNEQVKRNIERVPEDFMVQLEPGEFENLKSQFATSRVVFFRKDDNETIVQIKGKRYQSGMGKTKKPGYLYF